MDYGVILSLILEKRFACELYKCKTLEMPLSMLFCENVVHNTTIFFDLVFWGEMSL